jgi:hypothetical protein
VAVVITAVLLSDPDALFHAAGAWIALSSFAGLATAVTAAIAALVVELTIGQTDPHRSSRQTGLAG